MSGVYQNLDQSVLKYYGLHTPPIVQDFVAHNECYDSSETPSGVSCNTSFGVEVEMEKCNQSLTEPLPLWCVEGDGSLKDHGLEFISRPIKGAHFGKAFQELQHIFMKHPKSVFSHRCSIHVHMGVTDLTVSQLAVLVSAYIAAEKLFFNFVGESKRYNNAYCFPVVGSGATCTILGKQSICSNDAQKKYKYCGLNVYHLRDYGTLEFRHHPGTKDIDQLRGWMNAIGALYTYASKTTLKQHIHYLEMVSVNKDYAGFIEAIFEGALPGADQLSRSETRLMVLASKHFLADLY